MDKVLGGFILAMLLFIAFTTGIEEGWPGSNRFYVKQVSENAINSHYRLMQVDGRSSAWIVAERGRYHVGDTLSFQLR
jgi:hypothetical protein